MRGLAVIAVLVALHAPAFAAGESPRPPHDAVIAKPAQASIPRPALDALIAKHAQANGLPEPLVRRVILRESRYDPHVVGKGGAMGLMQIKHATARAMGYTGPAAGLLDPETNLTYAVRYLAGAYRAADGDADRAVSYYARGYYEAAKRKNIKIYAAPTPKAARLTARAARVPEQPSSAEAIY